MEKRNIKSASAEQVNKKVSIVDAIKQTMQTGALHLGAGQTVKGNIESPQDNAPLNVIQTQETEAFQTDVPIWISENLQIINAIDVDAVFDPGKLMYAAAVNRSIFSRDSVQPIKVAFNTNGDLARALGISATGFYEVHETAAMPTAVIMGVVRRNDTEVGDAEVSIVAGDLTVQMDLEGDHGRFVICPLSNANNRTYAWKTNPGVLGVTDADIELTTSSVAVGSEAQIVNDLAATTGTGNFQIAGINCVVTLYLVPLVDELLPAYHHFASTDGEGNLADYVAEYLGFQE